MEINIEAIKKKFVGEKVSVETESAVTVFRKVVDIIDSSTALKDPEIRSGVNVNKDLLYLMVGVIESIESKKDKNDPKKTPEEMIWETLESLSDGGKGHACLCQVYIYSDSRCRLLSKVLGLNEIIGNNVDIFNMINFALE